MENLRLNDIKFNIAAKIMAETKRLNELANSGQSPSVKDVEPLPLHDFREAFESYGEEFLSEGLLNRVLRDLKNRKDLLKEYYPEGSKFLIAAMPCNINGTLFSDEDIQNGEYLINFFIDESTGLSIGFGTLRPSTHAKMLPVEIQKRCSFTINYDSDKPYSTEEDFKKFANEYRKVYHELRKLLVQ